MPVLLLTVPSLPVGLFVVECLVVVVSHVDYKPWRRGRRCQPKRPPPTPLISIERVCQIRHKQRVQFSQFIGTPRFKSNANPAWPPVSLCVMDFNEQRQRIIDSVFSKRTATDESYVSHIKMWEDAGPDGGGRKVRFIILSRMSQHSPGFHVLRTIRVVETSNGSGYMHKAKLNNNGTFSVGKTWRVPELRGIQVTSVCSARLRPSGTI